jgi:hypothetical protein
MNLTALIPLLQEHLADAQAAVEALQRIQPPPADEFRHHRQLRGFVREVNLTADLLRRLLPESC